MPSVNQTKLLAQGKRRGEELTLQTEFRGANPANSDQMLMLMKIQLKQIHAR